jgi:hypothetical protein
VVTLHGIAPESFLIARWQMIRRVCQRQLKRTLLAIIFAVLLSLMLAPHSGSGRSLLRFAGYAHGPFFIMPSYVDGRPLVLQTIFIAVLLALVVNIPWPRRKKDDRD